ncbi:hypothetical protein B5S28_g2918 [[Candida] boidinii]|nr:hypothetical protein B5S28_g2918 [[Candida] boidinii]OWB61260.1 hypothetical protein B5S29_g2148 [[Candida] boidinii]
MAEDFPIPNTDTPMNNLVNSGDEQNIIANGTSSGSNETNENHNDDNDNDDDDEDDDEDDVDSITEALDQIGRLTIPDTSFLKHVNLNLKHFPTTESLYNMRQNFINSSGEFVSSKRQDLTKFIDDLKLKSNDYSSLISIENFHNLSDTLNDLVEEAISYPIDDMHHNNNNNEDTNIDLDIDMDSEIIFPTEPKGIEQVKEKDETPILFGNVESKEAEKLIQNFKKLNKLREKKLLLSSNNFNFSNHINSNNNSNDSLNTLSKNDRNIKINNDINLNKKLSAYNDLAKLSFEQFNDQQFLRSRIKKILSLKDLSPLEHRVLIQRLMSTSYIQTKRVKAKLENGEHEEGEEDDEEEEVDDEVDDDEDVEEEDDEEDEHEHVFLTEADHEPSFHNLEENILGCQHYQRNCKIECSVCRRWFPCRFCHDQVVASHNLPRDETKHILCMFCNTPQTPQQYCSNEKCGELLSNYFCEKCILFDNDQSKDIYHCDDCGICRLGLGLNQDYFHCKNCDACISIDLKEHHKCIENSTHANCPICDEYMFNSTKTVVFMNCGHPIHEICYNEFTKHSYRCPLCSRTIINMEAQFRVLDIEIKEQPLPDPMNTWNSIIKCVDCGGRSKVKFHFLGLKCDHCLSYNTMQLKLIKPEDNQNENDILKLMNGSDSISNDNNEQLSNSNNLNNREIDLISRTKMIKHSLNDNFEFSMVDNEAISEEDPEENTQDAEDELINTGSWEKGLFDHEYVDNFVRVINNFDKYSSIGDAFKDWLKNTIGDNNNNNNNNNDSKINKIEKNELTSGGTGNASNRNNNNNNNNNDNYDNDNDNNDDQMVEKHHNDFF